MGAPRLWVVVPAAGAGTRFGDPLPKQYQGLAGRPLIQWTLAPFLARDDVAALVVVLAPGDGHWASARPADPRLRTARGGERRQDSVAAGLAALADDAAADDWVLVHDAARPCLGAGDLDRLIAALADDPVGGLLAVPVSDTLKAADASGRIARTVEREGLWAAQTPQMFRYRALGDALAAAAAQGRRLTDEAAALEGTGQAPRLVPGSPDNLKITRREDLALAAAVLASREAA